MKIINKLVTAVALAGLASTSAIAAPKVDKRTTYGGPQVTYPDGSRNGNTKTTTVAPKNNNTVRPYIGTTTHSPNPTNRPGTTSVHGGIVISIP